MEDFNLTIDDIRKTGHCVRGIRRWFEANRLDFHGFMAGGIMASVMLATNDELAAEVVNKIRERQARG
jgi:hypothetical protein